jgi:hypothetical protein
MQLDQINLWVFFRVASRMISLANEIQNPCFNNSFIVDFYAVEVVSSRGLLLLMV